MILGCAHETTGYIGRVLMYYNPWSFVAFIIQISEIFPRELVTHDFLKKLTLSVCITQAPVFFCAAIYVTLAQT